jgi:hypothetical protein
MDAIAGTLKDAIGSVLEEARKVPPVQTQNPTQHVVIHSAEPPRPEPKMAWVCACAAVVSVISALFMGVLWLDAKADVRQVENDIKAIRAYINAGKVPVQPKGK